MTPAGIVLAIAVAAWGPIAPAPDATPAPAPAAPPVAPAASTVQPIAPPAPAPAGAASIQPAMVAKAPLDVRVKPVLVGTRDRPPQQPLYKNVGFWVVSGGIFVATVVITIVMTRPGPEPYSGNTPPYYVGLP